MTGGAGTAGEAGDAGTAGVTGAGSSTVMPKSVARPARPEAYPCPTARNFHFPCRRYNSPPMNAVSVPASMSNRASSAPVPASSSLSTSPGTCPNVPPSADAHSTTRSTAGSTDWRCTSTVSAAAPGALRFPRCVTASDE